MPCYHPIPGWFSRHVNASGKRSIVFNVRDAATDQKTEVPCGQCLGCRLERSRQWAMRCMHEAKLHEDNCFITLTYSDAYLSLLPQGRDGKASLDPRDFVLFMKRLRKAYDHPIRFFHCGEYGEQTERPHHHALLFGHRFDDLQLQSGRRTDGQQGISPELERLWGYGHCYVGDCTFESASYVARYSMKKITGPGADDHYQGRQPPYLTMSRRPGIASNFFDKYNAEIYNRDSCLINGREVKPPKFYDNKLEKLDQEQFLIVKDARKLAQSSNANNKPARLRVRERTATHRYQLFSQRNKL